MDDDGRQLLIMLSQEQVLLARALDLIAWMVHTHQRDYDDGPEDDGPAGPGPEHPNVKDHKVQPVMPEFMKEYA